MRKRLSIPLLLCSALLVYALVAEPPRITEPALETSEKPVPESYAFDVVVTDFDEQGRATDRTDARTLRRFASQAVVELDELRATHFSTGGPWIANADHGFLFENRDRLQLVGDVNLVYEVDGVRFSSEAMTLNLAANTARSDAPVRAWQGGNETRADTLLVNLDRQTAALTGTVVTVFEPQE